MLALIPLLFPFACKKKVDTEVVEIGVVGGAVAEAPPAEKAPPPAHVQTMMDNFARVYFDFDSATLNEESKAALAANAAIMQEHMDVKVQIEGHADEQGTTEYNLALGQKRAAAVAEYMIAQGIGPSRLSTRSFGEERPLVEGASETAYSQNRRAEFVITYGDGVQGTAQ